MKSQSLSVAVAVCVPTTPLPAWTKRTSASCWLGSLTTLPEVTKNITTSNGISLSPSKYDESAETVTWCPRARR